MEETHVIDVYNQIADHFRVTRTYKWTWVNDFLNKTDTGSKILDVGCGSGRNMQHENTERQFTGIDNSLVFIEMCRGKGLNVRFMDMCKTTFEDKVFDYTISCASFHHLATEERRLLALKEMKRVTKKQILLSVWSIKQPKKTRVTFDRYGGILVPWTKGADKFDRYYYIFRIEEIKALIKEADLTIVSHQWDCGNEVFVLE